MQVADFGSVRGPQACVVTKLKPTKKEIDEKVYKNDLPNGVNVLKNSIAAEYILEN